MLRPLLETDDRLTAPLLRLALAVVIFPHGAQKLLGWFGGSGFTGTVDFFTQSLGIPWIVAVLVIVGEFFGPLSLLLGFLTRVSAAAIGAIMVGAAAMVHLPYGFFMNWQGNQGGEGFEYHILAVGIALALMVAGGGRWSVDRTLTPAPAPHA